MYWITGILGLALMVSPFFFGYSENDPAMWTGVLFGGAVTLMSLLEWAETNRGKWEYWATAVVGIGAIVAPFMLGFGSVTTAVWVSVGAGLLLAFIAGSKLYYDQKSFR